MEKWKNMEKGQTNISLEEKYSSLIRIEANICPLCHQNFSSTTKLGRIENKKHLNDRFEHLLQNLSPSNDLSPSIVYPSKNNLETVSSESLMLQEHFGGNEQKNNQSESNNQNAPQQGNDVPSVNDLKQKFKDMQNNKN